MSTCRSCGMDVEPIDGICPECGTLMDDGTQSFAAVGVETPEATPEQAIPGTPTLIVQKGPEVGERFTLDGPSYTVGRDPNSDIFLNDVTVSRRHAGLEVVGEDVVLTDAGSLNGTYVNGTRVDRTVLTRGDVVQVGRFEMIFMAGGAA